MKIIAIEDMKRGGYTAFHSEFPSVVIEAENKEEIKEKLANVFHDIIMNSEIHVSGFKRYNDEND